VRKFPGPIAVIARTDILFRFRRGSTIVALLLIAAGVYLIVPAVESGRTLMQIDGRRVLYNSAAVALGTGMFCAIILSLVGYYLISNSFRRDIESRTGFIVAASQVTDAQYVMGKFLGNLAYLFGATFACMASAMVMFLIRGEGPIEPIVFLGLYAWTVGPVIVFCSAAGLLFEAFPPLSGRVGDVFYFFLWAALLGLPVSLKVNNARLDWLTVFDILGVTPIIGQIQEQFHTNSISIGSSTFDASRSPILYEGLSWSWAGIGERLSTLLMPCVLLVLARILFHRFDPVKIRISARRARANILDRLNLIMRPLTRFVGWMPSIGWRRRNRTSLFNAVLSDVQATFLLSPLAVVACLVFAVLSLTLSAGSVQEGVLPVIFVVLIITLSDIATRDRSSGMLNLLLTAPRLKPHYVTWKFLSALGVTLLFTGIPIIRMLAGSRPAVLSLVIGSCFTAGSAAALGVLANSRKPFMALLLMLLYVALNAPEQPAFNFAGFSARVNAGVQLSYALITLLLLAAAQARYRRLLR
jgi:hypothetical protein